MQPCYCSIDLLEAERFCHPQIIGASSSPVTRFIGARFSTSSMTSQNPQLLGKVGSTAKECPWVPYPSMRGEGEGKGREGGTWLPCALVHGRPPVLEDCSRVPSVRLQQYVVSANPDICMDVKIVRPANRSRYQFDTVCTGLCAGRINTHKHQQVLAHAYTGVGLVEASERHYTNLRRLLKVPVPFLADENKEVCASQNCQ